jgi:hypothetical protein
MASFVYDVAKKQARLAKAKKAHDQERGEVAGPRDGDHRRSDRERLPVREALNAKLKAGKEPTAAGAAQFGVRATPVLPGPPNAAQMAPTRKGQPQQ